MTEFLKKVNVYNEAIILILVLGIDPLLKISGYINDTNYINSMNYFVIFLIFIYYIIKIFLYYTDNDKKLINMVSFIIATIFIIFFVSYLVDDKSQYLRIINDKNLESYITLKEYYKKFLMGTLSFFIIYLVIGENLVNVINLYLMNRYIKNILFIIYFANIAAFIISMIQFKTFSINANIYFEGNTICLYLGDVFTLYSIIIICLTKNYLTKMAFCLNSFFWLYKIGSRTSFYCYIVVLVFIIAKYSLKGTNIKTIILVCFNIIIAISIFWYSYYNIENINLNSRMTMLVTDISEDESYNGRKSLLNDGINDIKQHWFIGNMFAEIKRQGITGGYIHSVLSYWVEFGIIPFVCIIFLIGNNFYNNLKFYFSQKNSVVVEIIFSLSIFIFLCAIISRSYVYPYIWLALASSYDLNYLEKRVQLNTNNL